MVKNIKKLEDFVTRQNYSFTDQQLEKSTPFCINFKDLKNDAKLLEQWPDFLQDLHSDPTTVLNCLSLVVHQVSITK